MRAGRLRESITIQRNTPSQDARGQTVDDWQTLATVRADMKQTGGSETEQSHQIIAKADWEALIRWRADLKPKPADRVIYADHTLEILSVRNKNQRDREMHLELKDTS